ncbi:MAG: hypothetical protein U0514_02415 [Candidatus Andersenbacteria bacterium]
MASTTTLTAVALARLIELLPKVGLADATVKASSPSICAAPLVRQTIQFDPALTTKLTGVEVATRASRCASCRA